MKVVFLPSVFPGPSVPAFFVDKIGLPATTAENYKLPVPHYVKVLQ